MRVTRTHRDKVDRYIPGDFDRSLHAKDGVPICRGLRQGIQAVEGSARSPAPSPPHLKPEVALA